MAAAGAEKTPPMAQTPPPTVKNKKRIKMNKDVVRTMFRAHSKRPPTPDDGVKEEAANGPSSPGKNKDTNNKLDPEDAPTVFELVGDGTATPAVCHERERKRKWKEDGKKVEEEAVKTIFEVIGVESNPVKLEKANDIKWKDGVDGAKERERHRMEMEAIILPDAPDYTKDPEFIVACKIMVQIRQSNILELVLSHEDILTMRKFFEGGMEQANSKVISLLHKSMETAYTRVVFHAEQYDIIMDAPMQNLMVDKEKALSRLLDVILTVPDYLPLMWGGRNVGIQICESSVALSPVVDKPNDDKVKMTAASPPASPWTAMVNQVMEENNGENKKEEAPLVVAEQKTMSNKEKERENEKEKGKAKTDSNREKKKNDKRDMVAADAGAKGRARQVASSTALTALSPDTGMKRLAKARRAASNVTLSPVSPMSPKEVNSKDGKKLVEVKSKDSKGAKEQEKVEPRRIKTTTKKEARIKKSSSAGRT